LEALFLLKHSFCRHDAEDAKIAPDFLGLSSARLGAAIKRLWRLIEFSKNRVGAPMTARAV
jgi:hypothetical protein